MTDIEFSPFDLSQHNKQAESVGTKVKLPDNGEGHVVKFDKVERNSTPIHKLVEDTLKMKRREEVAQAVASKRTKEAIVPQDYVISQGNTPETARIVRTQEYIEGKPLKKLGFAGIINLPDQEIETLKSVLVDSMKCFLQHGTNYDLFGSDISDKQQNERILNIKRLIFPLRNSSNLMITSKGVKLIDPNVLGNPDGKKSIQSMLLQSLLFTSSAADYSILSARQLVRKVFHK